METRTELTNALANATATVNQLLSDHDVSDPGITLIANTIREAGIRIALQIDLASTRR